MKKFLSGLLAFGLIPLLPVYAQGKIEPEKSEKTELKSAEISWGDSAFTSGLNVSLLFALNGERNLQLVGNSERFYTILDFKVHKKLALGASGGTFKKIPWAGPIITCYPVKPVMLMYWSGYSTGRIGNLRAELKSFFQQFSGYVTPDKHLSIGYTAIKYDVYKTDHLPEIDLYHWLKKDLRLGASATYDVVQKKPLFCLYLRYIPTQK